MKTVHRLRTWILSSLTFVSPEPAIQPVLNKYLLDTQTGILLKTHCHGLYYVLLKTDMLKPLFSNVIVFGDRAGRQFR